MALRGKDPKERGVVGIVFSSFDIMHFGYALLILFARKRCDYLIVGLHDDPSTERSQKNKPIMSAKERKLIMSLFADKVIIYRKESDIRRILLKEKPDVRFRGSDHKGQPATGDDLGIKIIYHNRNHDWSSTKTRKLIYEAEKARRGE